MSQSSFFSFEVFVLVVIVVMTNCFHSFSWYDALCSDDALTHAIVTLYTYVMCVSVKCEEKFCAFSAIVFIKTMSFFASSDFVEMSTVVN